MRLKTWLIESIPVSEKVIDEYGYTKSLVFVRQDNLVVVRGVFFVKKGKKTKKEILLDTGGYCG